MNVTAVRLTLIASALCSVGLISFPTFPSTLVSKPDLVNRSLKGNRLNVTPLAVKKNARSQPALVSWEASACGLRSRFQLNVLATVFWSLRAMRSLRRLQWAEGHLG
jgi:hypothetical protein